MIRAEHLVKTFGTGPGAVRAVDDVSFDVADGEVFGVIGQSGAGKSTLLRLINGLAEPDSGTVEVADTHITGLTGAQLRAARHGIGMIFQHFNLLSSRTVRRNVEFTLEVTGYRRDKRRARADEILELVGLTSLADAYPAQLSGGQKQRVGIARALAPNPQLLLSDEATSALDPETTRSILELLRTINRELGVTILLITHEMDVVTSVCTSAALMEQGRFVEQGTIRDLLRTPGSRLAGSLFPLGEVPEGDTTVVEITFDQDASPDSPVIAQLVRQHDIDVSILGAAIETVSGNQVGRIRVELPGSASQVGAALASLRSQGLFVETIKGAR